MNTNKNSITFFKSRSTNDIYARSIKFRKILKKTTKQIMRKKPKTINQEMFAADALEIMEKNKITQLFVVKNNTPIGILHIHDCVELGLI